MATILYGFSVIYISYYIYAEIQEKFINPVVNTEAKPRLFLILMLCQLGLVQHLSLGCCKSEIHPVILLELCRLHATVLRQKELFYFHI